MKQNSMSERRFSQTVEMMRFPLIVLVVVAHMVPFATPQVQLTINIDDIYVFLSELFSHNLAKISVRCYFLISGYFFFKFLENWDWGVFQEKLRKKVRTLFIPYVIWNAVLLIAIVVKHHAFDLVGLGKDEGWYMLKSTTLYDWFWGMPVNFPLWYMRDLIVMVIMAPLFFWFFKYTKFFGLLILGGLYLSLIEFNVPGISTTALFFFGAGSYLAINNIDIISLFVKYWVGIAAVTVLALLVATFNNGTAIHEPILRIFIILGVITTVSLFDYLTKFEGLKKVFFKLAPTTFFIYVVHEIYIINWLKGALQRIAPEGWERLVGYFIVPWICITICIGLFYLIRRLFPGLMNIALGGRVVSKVKN